MMPMRRSSDRLSDGAESEREAITNMPRRRWHAKLLRSGSQILDLRHWLVIHEEVRSATGRRRLTRKQHTLGHIADVDERNMIVAATDNDHFAALDHRGEAREAGHIAWPVDPARTHNRHWR